MKKFLLFVVLLGIGSVAGCSLLYPNWGTTVSPSDSMTASPTEPTATDSANPEPTETQAVQKKNAKVEIMMADLDTSAKAISVVAQVVGIAESTGTCTLTFQGANSTETLTVKAEANVSDTQCFPMNLSYSDLPKGAGLVTVTYESEGYKGTSAASAVTIP